MTMDPPGSIAARVLKSLKTFLILAINTIPFSIYREVVAKATKLDDLPKRTGEIAVITGGARGIGYEVVKRLLMCDFRVIIGVRNVQAGDNAVKSIRDLGVTTGSTKILQLDLQSLKSVRVFADNVLKEAERIDLLINNAGIMLRPFEETEDGYESQFQTNYLGHFLLTNLLLAKIKETSLKKELAGRIVNVSSDAHYGGNLDFNDLEKVQVYSRGKSYSDSKLAQVLHAKYLDKQLHEQAAKVRVYSLHPGVIPSNLWAHLGIINNIIDFFKGIFKTVENGADVVVFTALAPELENDGGVYIANCKKWKPLYRANDLALQQSLWERSLQLSNVKN